MNDKQREATKIVLQQCSEGHLDAEETLKIIDTIFGEIPQAQYVPYQPIDLSPKPWDTNDMFTVTSVTCEQGGMTVDNTDTPNGSSVTTKGNVAMHYTNGKRKHHGDYEWDYVEMKHTR